MRLERRTPKLEQQYRFNGFGDTKTIHDETTNKTYAIEFNGLEKNYGHGAYREAHFTVYDVGAQGKMKIGDIGIGDVYGQDIALPGTRMNLDVDIGNGYVDLKITEQ